MFMPSRILVVLLLVTSWPVFADSITVSDAWVRATPPGARTAAVYLTLVNGGKADVLLGATTPSAREVQIHTHSHADGMMRMEQLESLELPGEERTVLEPGGDHLMLVGISAPLQAGQAIDLELDFAGNRKLALTIPVRDTRQGD